jgi:hypothetical protein
LSRNKLLDTLKYASAKMRSSINGKVVELAAEIMAKAAEVAKSLGNTTVPANVDEFLDDDAEAYESLDEVVEEGKQANGCPVIVFYLAMHAARDLSAEIIEGERVLGVLFIIAFDNTLTPTGKKPHSAEQVRGESAS